MGKIRRNDPCPCGSGKKYKYCCFESDYVKVTPEKKDAHFTLDTGTKISHPVTSIDSIPTHNKNGLSPDITPEQMMDLCIDEVHKIIVKEEVGMIHELLDKVIMEMDIIPTFTYKQFSERITEDKRFELVYGQICSLKGADPVELMAKKLKL